jgi:hypothetical protein
MKPQTQRVLQALSRAHHSGLTAVQLAHPGIGALDYRKRISEVRREGWTIDSLSIPGKPYNRYILRGKTP